MAAKILCVAWLLAPLPDSAQAAQADEPRSTRIPAMDGRVVDAVTGQPVADVDVILTALASGNTPLRYDNSRTSPQGKFQFAQSRVDSRGWPALETYWLSVNVKYLSAEWMKRNWPNRQPNGNPEGEDLSLRLESDPLFNRKVTQLGDSTMTVAGPRVNSKAYFPMAVQLIRACGQKWNANCLSLTAAGELRIPLVPVLEDAAACGKISDAAVAEKCRQLNTYRAAFRHVASLDEIRKGKELCGAVDQGPGTEACLGFLHAYVRRFDLFEGGVPPRALFEAIGEVLILKPVGTLAVVRSMLWENTLDPFTQTALYEVRYGARGSQWTAATAMVWRGGWDPYYSDIGAGPGDSDASKKAAMRTERIDGSSVTVLETPEQTGIRWSSGNKIVRIFFPNRAAGDQVPDATPEMRRELIRQYLLQYPSE